MYRSPRQDQVGASLLTPEPRRIGRGTGELEEILS
jgi:hypothetical protein